MLNTTKKITFFTTALMFVCANVKAQTPLIQTKYTADPAPMVKGDTVFLYTTHDEDDADGFKMKDWLLYTSTDMVNWTDHGAVASLKNFSWVKKDNGAWAIKTVERNGKYYMYCPIHGNGIGVLVADSPYGPFKDPIGKPLVWQDHGWNDIDPTVWIDDDGQAYLYWGNPDLFCVKLNEDMISCSGRITKFPKITDYQEGPWFYKHAGHYYMAFASTCCPEGIGYAMSDSPMGPWIYKGHIIDHTRRSNGNHPGIIDFKGKSFVFGLNYDLMHLETMVHHERRSVSAAEIHYNADGTIQMLPYWLDNAPIAPLGTLNPYRRVEAETMAWGYGLKTEESERGISLVKIDDGDSLVVKAVDFGKKGAKSFSASVAAAKPGSVIEIHLDNNSGPVVGTLKVGAASAGEYKSMSCKVKGTKGVHDLHFLFKGSAKSDLFKWDWWKFDK